MAKIETLQELYVDELKDLWSANDQMEKALRKIAPQATNKKLLAMLKNSQDGHLGPHRHSQGADRGRNPRRRKRSTAKAWRDW